MSDTSTSLVLPEDLQACHALIEQLTLTVQEQQQENEALQLELAELLQRAVR